MLTVVPDDCPDQPGASGGSSSLIDEIVREGALVRAGAHFEPGVLVERPETAAA
jgi:hypothetical protein